MFRRLIAIAFGFVVAVAAGSMFLAIGALIDPATREACFEAVEAGLFAIMDEALSDGAPEMAASALGMMFQAIFIATCVAPLAVAALIGEIAGARLDLVRRRLRGSRGGLALDRPRGEGAFPREP